jgi:hypothetical protein
MVTVVDVSDAVNWNIGPVYVAAAFSWMTVRGLSFADDA